MSEDPLVVGKQYGMIHNAGVVVSPLLCEAVRLISDRFLQRRTARRPPGVAPSTAAAKNIKNIDNKSEKARWPDATIVKSSDQVSPSDKLLPQATATPNAKADLPRASGKAAASKPANVKREQSDIFKSFSKPKAKLQNEDTDTLTVPPSAPATALSVSKTN